MDSILARIDRALSNRLASGTVTLIVAIILYIVLAFPLNNLPVKLVVLAIIMGLVRTKNNGAALIVAILFAVVLTVMSYDRRCPVCGMSHDPEDEHPHSNDIGTDVHEEVTPGPVSTASWDSKDGVNKIQLRGQVYISHDIKNLLPGGHGDNIEGH